MANMYSSLKGILGNLINPNLTATQTGTGWTGDENYFNLNAWDNVSLGISGKNDGNYGIVENLPDTATSHLGFTATVNCPTGYLVAGFPTAFDFDLHWNNSSTTIASTYTTWFYSGYSATGTCFTHLSQDGGIPRISHLYTTYGSGVSAYSSITKYTTGTAFITSGPYTFNVPARTSNDASSMHVNLSLIFTASKNSYAYDGFKPLLKQ